MRFVCAPKDNPEPESNSNNNSNSQSELTLASFYRLRGPVVVTLSVNKIYKCQPCFSFHSHTAGWRNTVSIHAPAHGKYRLITLIKTCSRFCLPVVLHAIMNQQMTTSRERERERASFVVCIAWQPEADKMLFSSAVVYCTTAPTATIVCCAVCRIVRMTGARKKSPKRCGYRAVHSACN